MSTVPSPERKALADFEALIGAAQPSPLIFDETTWNSPGPGAGNEVQRGWDALWSCRLAGLIRERSKSLEGQAPANDSPGVELAELGGKYRFDPYPYSLVRRMRRVFNRFQLESFVEDRGYSDYRSALEQEVVGLIGEARETAVEVAGASLALTNFRRMLAENHVSAPPALKARLVDAERDVSDMIDSVERVRSQVTSVLTFDDQGFAASLFERLRALHQKIQASWGTWTRRVKVPALRFVFGLLLVLVIQSLWGLAMGTSLFLLPALLVPILWSGWNYFSARARVNKEIEKEVSVLMAFNPEPVKDGYSFRRGTIWHPDEAPLDLAQSSYTALITDRTGVPGTSSSRLDDIRVSSWAWGLALTAVGGFLLLIPVATFFLKGAVPAFTVEGMASESSCALSRGHILWPGPIDVLVLESENGMAFTTVARDRVVKISPSPSTLLPDGVAGARPCAQASNINGERAHPSLVMISTTRAQDRGVVVIPFPTPPEPIPCGVPEDSKWLQLGVESKDLLSRLGSALRRCGSPESPVVVDVRGFASSSRFKGTCEPYSDEENLKLAEVRRMKVLSSLEIAARGSPGDHVRLSPADSPRWSSFAHMRDFGSVRDTINGEFSPSVANISQRAEVWLLNLGSCNGADLPVFAR